MITKENLKKLISHLKTVCSHRKYVRRMCFKMGIPLQGLIHDLSKYSLTELSIYKYYDGSVSPHQRSRELKGYSSSWNHHYHHNKHHWEYWLDNQDGADFVPIKIPYKYVIEMVCDMTGAGKAYLKNKWTSSSPLDYYYAKCYGKRIMHNTSERLLVYLLTEIKDRGLKNFIKFYRKNKSQIKEIYKNDKDFNINKNIKDQE